MFANVLYCIHTGQHVEDSTQYYYGIYLFHYRCPWSQRVLDESVVSMNAVEDEDRVTVCQKLASQCGFTGVGILHRLHHLYDFNILKDMVFDAMHMLILREVLKHLQVFQEGGILKNPLIEERLKKIPWVAGEYILLFYMSWLPTFATEMKDGRLPEGIARRLGFWKAEEIPKVSLPCI